MMSYFTWMYWPSQPRYWELLNSTAHVLLVAVVEQQCSADSKKHKSYRYSSVDYTAFLRYIQSLLVMKFIRHNCSASTIQSLHILENKRPEIKKVTKKYKMPLKTHSRLLLMFLHHYYALRHRGALSDTAIRPSVCLSQPRLYVHWLPAA